MARRRVAGAAAAAAFLRPRTGAPAGAGAAAGALRGMPHDRRLPGRRAGAGRNPRQAARDVPLAQHPGPRHPPRRAEGTRGQTRRGRRPDRRTAPRGPHRELRWAAGPDVRGPALRLRRPRPHRDAPPPDRRAGGGRAGGSRDRTAAAVVGFRHHLPLLVHRSPDPPDHRAAHRREQSATWASIPRVSPARSPASTPARTCSSSTTSDPATSSTPWTGSKRTRRSGTVSSICG